MSYQRMYIWLFAIPWIIDAHLKVHIWAEKRRKWDGVAGVCENLALIKGVKQPNFIDLTH